MAKRVLTSAEEYGIAVYYVCGVPIKVITQIYDISRMTLTRVLRRLDVDIDRKAAGQTAGRTAGGTQV